MPCPVLHSSHWATLRAAENLELALLIDPENGSAMVDYAEVLFGIGQVSSAVDINQLILERVTYHRDWLSNWLLGKDVGRQ